MPKFLGMPHFHADQFRAGGPDAYGNPPEREISDGTAPCRCCLKLIPEGVPMLALAYRPFAALHAYAETGPIFICAQSCAPSGAALPEVIVSSEYLLKAYAADERIIYGTGQITPRCAVEDYAEALLTRTDVAFVDVRSAKNNCWQARITRD